MMRPYNFEKREPPLLTEKMLQAERGRRAVRRQTAALALAGSLSLLCMLLASLLLYRFAPAVSIALLGYTCVSVTGGGVLAVVFVQKRREFLWQE